MNSYSLHATSMIQKAEIFATAAHGASDQRRKYTGVPYIVHPETVAAIVGVVPGHTWQMICAAWLHDVLEDTRIERPAIEKVFGKEVADMVEALTNVPLSAGNRAIRYQMNLRKLAEASPEVQTIKLADLIDNTRSIAAHDPSFASVYLREKRWLLEVMNRGDATLWSMAWRQCNQALEQIA